MSPLVPYATFAEEQFLSVPLLQDIFSTICLLTLTIASVLIFASAELSCKSNVTLLHNVTMSVAASHWTTL